VTARDTGVSFRVPKSRARRSPSKTTESTVNGSTTPLTRKAGGSWDGTFPLLARPPIVAKTIEPARFLELLHAVPSSFPALALPYIKNSSHRNLDRTCQYCIVRRIGGKLDSVATRMHHGSWKHSPRQANAVICSYWYALSVCSRP